MAAEAPFHYDRLSSQDATFLDLEGPTAPQHVAATMVLRSGSLRTPEGGVDIDPIPAYLASPLHTIPPSPPPPPAGPPPPAARAAREPPGLGRRRALLDRLPRAPHGAAAAGRPPPAEAALR